MARSKKSKELFFVRETPDDYKVELSKSKRISKNEFNRLLNESKKKPKKDAA